MASNIVYDSSMFIPENVIQIFNGIPLYKFVNPFPRRFDFYLNVKYFRLWHDRLLSTFTNDIIAFKYASAYTGYSESHMKKLCRRDELYIFYCHLMKDDTWRYYGCGNPHFTIKSLLPLKHAENIGGGI